LLFHLLSKLYERTSIIFTTISASVKWSAVFGTRLLINASFFDRFMRASLLSQLVDLLRRKIDLPWVILCLCRPVSLLF